MSTEPCPSTKRLGPEYGGSIRLHCRVPLDQHDYTDSRVFHRATFHGRQHEWWTPQDGVDGWDHVIARLTGQVPAVGSTVGPS